MSCLAWADRDSSDSRHPTVTIPIQARIFISRIVMSQQGLNRADVSAALVKVGGKGMVKCMGADTIGQAHAAYSGLDRLVDHAGVNMMMAYGAATGAVERSRAGNTYCQPHSLPLKMLKHCPSRPKVKFDFILVHYNLLG